MKQVSGGQASQRAVLEQRDDERAMTVSLPVNNHVYLYASQIRLVLACRIHGTLEETSRSLMS